MGIAEDYYGLKGHWSKLSLATKVVFILSFTLTILSVGSLADSVFKFKGFIVYGIEFYKLLIQPIKIVLSKIFGFDIPHTAFDVFALGCIWLKVISIKDNGSVERGNRGLVFVGAVLCAFAIVFIKFFLLVLGETVTFLILFPLLSFIFSFGLNKNNKVTPIMLLQAGYFLIAYFVVACIAAIGEGLARPLPG